MVVAAVFRALSPLMTLTLTLPIKAIFGAIIGFGAVSLAAVGITVLRVVDAVVVVHGGLLFNNFASGARAGHG